MQKVNAVRVIVCFSILFSLFANPGSASACSCVTTGSPAQEFSKAEAVFTGTVVRITDNYTPFVSFVHWFLDRIRIYPGSLYYEQFWGYSVTFSVDRSWKFVDTTAAEVETGKGGGDCGYPFNVGDNYVVYADRVDGAFGSFLMAHTCSRTSEVSRATDDLSHLNALPALNLKPSLQISPWISWLACIMLFLLVIASTVLWHHYRHTQPHIGS